MDSRIEELLARYWECETSLEEEQELRDYFNKGDATDELKETKSLFQYFNEQKRQSLSKPSFDKQLKERMSSKEGGDNVRKMFFNVAKIAAGILVLVTATYFVKEEIRKSYPEEIADTYSDPELAFEETKKALLMISKTFGKAQHQAGKIQLFNEAEQIIQGNEDTAKEKEKINI